MEIDKFLLKIALESNDFESGVNKVNKAIDTIGDQADATERRKTAAAERDAKAQKKIAEKAANDQKKIADKSANDQIALEKKLANEIEKNKYHSTASQRKALKSAVDPEVVNAKKIAEKAKDARTQAEIAASKIGPPKNLYEKQKTADKEAITAHKRKLDIMNAQIKNAHGKNNAIQKAKKKTDDLAQKNPLNDSHVKAFKENNAAIQKTADDAEKAKRKHQEALGAWMAKPQKEEEEQVRKTSNAYSGLLKAIVGIGAAYLSYHKIKNSFLNINDADTEVGRLAPNLGVSVKELSVWEGAVRHAGGSAEGLANSLQNMVTSVQDLKLHGTTGVLTNGAFVGMNMDAGKFLNEATNPIEKLMMLRKAFQGMSREKAQYHGSLFGIDQGTINMLLMGDKIFNHWIKNQDQGNSINQKRAEQAIAFNDAMLNLSDSMTVFGRNILVAVTPALEGMMSEFSKWIGKKQNVDAIASAFKDVATHVKNIMKYIADADFTELFATMKALQAIFDKAMDGYQKIWEFAHSDITGDAKVALDYTVANATGIPQEKVSAGFDWMDNRLMPIFDMLSRTAANLVIPGQTASFAMPSIRQAVGSNIVPGANTTSSTHDVYIQNLIAPPAAADLIRRAMGMVPNVSNTTR